MGAFHSLLVLLCSAAPILAQLPYTAYPIDALHGSFGHWTPLAPCPRATPTSPGAST